MASNSKCNAIWQHVSTCFSDLVEGESAAHQELRHRLEAAGGEFTTGVRPRKALVWTLIRVCYADGHLNRKLGHRRSHVEFDNHLRAHAALDLVDANQPRHH